MNIKSKNLGVAGIFAYLLIIANTISGFLLAPFILRTIGENLYGVYSTISAFAATSCIVDLGVTQTLIRYVSNFKANKRSDTDISKLCNSIKLINGVVVTLNVIVSVILFFSIPRVYNHSFTSTEISTSQILFVFCSISIIVSLISNYYSGIISGYGYFAFVNVTKSLHVIFRVLLVFIFIAIYKNVYAIVTIEVLLSIAFLIANFIYVKKQINLPHCSGYVEKYLIVEIAFYTFFLFMQNIVDQVNNHLDSILIGALVSSSAVAIYSFGLNIFHMFQNLSTSISQMLVPYMSEKIANNASSTELENSLIKIGKIQYIIVGAAFFGFIAMGKEFVSLWLGNGFSSVWTITLILMFGGLWPLIQNGAIAILKAKNLMAFRTTAIFCMAVTNALLTYFLVKWYGYVYAAVGTAIGFILVNTIIMDIYYYKKIGLNMARVMWQILKGISPCGFLAMFSSWIVINYFPLRWLYLVFSMTVFLLVYFGLLWSFVLDNESKKFILNKIHIYG